MPNACFRNPNIPISDPNIIRKNSLEIDMNKSFLLAQKYSKNSQNAIPKSSQNWWKAASEEVFWMNFISVLGFDRFLQIFSIFCLRWMLFFFVFYAFSAHVQASISTRRVNGGHAYYTVKTNEKSTFSGFYVFHIFVWGTDFLEFSLHIFLSNLLHFWRAWCFFWMHFWYHFGWFWMQIGCQNPLGGLLGGIP